MSRLKPPSDEYEKEKMENTAHQLPLDDSDFLSQKEKKKFGCPKSVMHIQYYIYMFADAHAEMHTLFGEDCITLIFFLKAKKSALSDACVTRACIYITGDGGLSGREKTW